MQDWAHRGLNPLTPGQLLIFAFFATLILFLKQDQDQSARRSVSYFNGLTPDVRNLNSNRKKIGFMRFLPNSIFVLGFIEEMEKLKVCHRTMSGRSGGGKFGQKCVFVGALCRAGCHNG